MKKLSLLMVLGLAAIIGSAATPKANAEVVVGVRIGGPVYVHPVRVYGYVAPAYVRPVYVAPRAYVAIGPRPYYRRAYVAPVRVFHRDRFYGPRVIVHRDYYGYRR